MSDKCDLCLLGLIILSSLLTGISGVDDAHVFISFGEDVCLPCNNALSDCTSTTWIYNRFRHSRAVELIAGGKVKNNIERRERLSLGSKCSLNIKSVTEQDYGDYTCRQYVNDRQHGTDARVFLHARPRSTTPLTNSQDPSTINTHGSKAQDDSTTAGIPVHIPNSTIKTPETNTNVILYVAVAAVFLLAVLWLICRKIAVCYMIKHRENKRGAVDSEVIDENEHKETNEMINMSIPPAERANEQTDDHVTYTEVTFSKKKPEESLNDHDDTVTYTAIRGREDQPQEELYASVNKNKTVTNKH